jgi:Tfp pilus assembly protein FimT
MSLLESCLAVAVISVAAMIAIPSLMKARETYELDAVARQVAGKMQSARLKAVSRNQDCRVRANSEVSLMVECKDAAWIPDDILVVPPGFRISANAAPQFHRRGNASPTATVSVWNRNSRTRRIIVNIAGRIRVE